MLRPLLAALPSLEVGARLAYWRIPLLRRLGDLVRARKSARRRAAPVVTPQPISFGDCEAALKSFGIGEGDILIVHSSFAALKPTNLEPEEIIRRLKAIVGDSGTLAMPAIAIVRGEPQGDDKFSDAAYDKLFEYDARSTRIGTGVLPKTLMGMPGAARSRFPGNSMVAWGPQAEAMMAGNIDPDSSGRAPTACGPNSSWAYAYRNNAKIVAIGIDLVHSLTMIHVAEDAFENDWPVAAAKWYRGRRFRVRDGEFSSEIAIRERRHAWSQFYAERRFSADLFKAGIASAATIGNLTISFCAAGAMVDYLRGHRRPTYPYVFPLGLRRSDRR